MKVTVPCHCGNTFEYEYSENAEINRETAESIKHGKFMNAICSKCGITMKPEFPVMFTYPEKNMKIFLIPELQRDSFLRGKSAFVEKKPDRFVIGFRELAEKIRILESALDDINVECVKYYILSKIETESKTENEIRIYFDSLKDDKLTFHIHGLKDNEIGILAVDMDFYRLSSEKAEKSISEEPFRSFLTPPYISILRVYREYTENIK